MKEYLILETVMAHRHLWQPQQQLIQMREQLLVADHVTGKDAHRKTLRP